MGDTVYRGQQLISLSDASRDDLEALVTNLVETGAVSAETVKSQLDQIRAKTGERLIAASKVESPVEQAEQLLDVGNGFAQYHPAIRGAANVLGDAVPINQLLVQQRCLTAGQPTLGVG